MYCYIITINDLFCAEFFQRSVEHIRFCNSHRQYSGCDGYRVWSKYILVIPIYLSIYFLSINILTYKTQYILMHTYRRRYSRSEFSIYYPICI